jgi:hypothetical protein
MSISAQYGYGNQSSNYRGVPKGPRLVADRQRCALSYLARIQRNARFKHLPKTRTTGADAGAVADQRSISGAVQLGPAAADQPAFEILRSPSR